MLRSKHLGDPIRRLSVPELKISDRKPGLTPALAAVIFRAVWNLAFSTSSLLNCESWSKKVMSREHLQAIRKTPEKEEDRDQCDGKDGLLDSQGRSTCETPIRHRLSMRVDFHIGRSALL